MANTQSTTPNQSNATKKRVITSIWLIMALLSGVTALALWMFSSAPAFNEAKVTKEEEKIDEVTSSNIGRIKSIDELNELDNAVQPISFDALVRDLRDYPPEFKDAKFFKKHKGEWTVQVMDVSEHEIIMDYLNTRDDREKFAYFRYRDDDNQARYLLTYGMMRSPQLAMGTAKTINFDLPANVTVLPEEVDVYLDLIENYELTPPIKDLSTNRARKIKLQPTKRELEVRTQSTRNNEPKLESQEQSNMSAQSSNSSNNGVASEQIEQKPIRDSKDTSDVLSVQEQRKIDQQLLDSGNSNNNAANKSLTPTDNNQSSKDPNISKETKPKVAEPAKPSEKKMTKETDSSSSASQTKNVDKIKQLIDQKTQ